MKEQLDLQTKQQQEAQMIFMDMDDKEILYNYDRFKKLGLVD